MLGTFSLTVREAIRYRGRSGHYSWLAHRVSGLAILAFLLVHVWDTANAHFYPELYDWSITIFKYPLIAVGEIPLMAAVLYHAFNGIRITILDFKPELWRYQQQSAILVWAIFLIVFVPIGIYMFTELYAHCIGLSVEHGASCWAFPRLSDYLN